MTTYLLVEVLSPALLVLRSEHGQQVWSQATLRKIKRCVGCHQDQPVGAQVFRPLTNGQNRYHRLCQRCVPKH